MNPNSLTRFDLHFPGFWIEGADRDWASESNLALKHIQSLFAEAVAAYSKFAPITAKNYEEVLKINESPYERPLNGIYAKAFVFALDGVSKILSKICMYLNPPPKINTLKKEYEEHFGHLKHIRDSAIHLEDRGRGKTRHEKPLNTSVIILGSFIERRFVFTGEDGTQYEIEISDSTLLKAKKILQEIINSYPWGDNFKINNGLTE